MITSYRRNLDKPGTYLVNGCDREVTLYPVIITDDTGSDIELPNLLMDEQSTINIDQVRLDQFLQLDDDGKPLVTIVNSTITGSVFLKRGVIVNSYISSTGIIDTRGDIINSKLDGGDISIEIDASVISVRTHPGSMLMMCNQAIITDSDLNGTLIMTGSSAIHDTKVNLSKGVCSLMGHSVIVKCTIDKQSEIYSDVVIYNNDVIHGTPVTGLDRLWIGAMEG